MTADPVRERAETSGARPMALVPGTVIGKRYMIEEQLGLGGHGAVHRAVHLGLDLPVAVKVVAVSTIDESQQRQVAQRFAREARTLARIRHRNVVAVHDTGILPDGSPYLVVELIEGEDLEQHLIRAPLTIPAVVDLGRQLFAALTALAEANVLHRDVKPANVMLHRESDERVLVKLIDFGIAHGPEEAVRLTVPGQILGTPHYMPPEQLRGELLDVRADLYSACAVLYEALTRQPPFDGPTAPVVIGKILGAPLVPIREQRPDCPEALARFIERGLAKKRAERLAHPLACVAELDAIAEQLGVATGALAWARESLSSESRSEAAERAAAAETSDLPSAARLSPLTRPHGKTPPDGTPEPPEEEPRPLDPESEPPPLPEVPGHIQDPPPHHYPGPGGMLLIAALGALAGITAASAAAPRAARLLGRSDASVAHADVAISAAVPQVPSTLVVPDVLPLLDRGFEALVRGEVDAALSSYREACNVAPDRVEAHRGRGLAAARAGRPDEAIAAFEHYLALAPDAPDADRVRARLRVLRRSRSTSAPP